MLKVLYLVPIINFDITAVAAIKKFNESIMS